MNCPVSRRSLELPEEGHDQSSPRLNQALTTRSSTSENDGSDAVTAPISVNRGQSRQPDNIERKEAECKTAQTADVSHGSGVTATRTKKAHDGKEDDQGRKPTVAQKVLGKLGESCKSPMYGQHRAGNSLVLRYLLKSSHNIKKYMKFIGPGFMVSVAYIDPGMNLAENCKMHLPRWLNYVLYVFAEAAIIATDIAEVIGTAIALNILLKVPLIAGCAISIVDVFVILFFYNPTGMSMRAVRLFELFVAFMVLGVVGLSSLVCCSAATRVNRVVFARYISQSLQIGSLYLSCGILGATVMPHSLYLGSGIVQNRLIDFDQKNYNLPLMDESASTIDNADSVLSMRYHPSLAAIRYTMKYSILELVVSLFTFALFINSAILVTAGASLSHLSKEEIENADLFAIHGLLSSSIAPIAGTIFALALLLSGVSAGVVCTIAGQMISEGQLVWVVKPWVRRLITRGISIGPSIIIAGSVGREGLSTALQASQVALSVMLPFIMGPLLYFTWNAKIMSVTVSSSPADAAVSSEPRIPNDTEYTAQQETDVVIMKNGWIVTIIGITAWLVITVMNVASLVLLGLGSG